MKTKTNQQGRLYLTNKVTGEERVYTGDFKRIYDALIFLEQGLTELFSANVQFKYKKPEEGKLLGDPEEASAETEQWAARVITEQLFREENSLPPIGEEE